MIIFIFYFSMVVFLGYDPRKQYIKESLANYFQDPVLYKIPSKNPEIGMDMYAIRIESFLLKERRFLIVLVARDPTVPYGHPTRLSGLEWTVLQTRHLSEEDDALDRLPAVQYEVRRTLFDGYVLRAEDSTEDITSYRVEPSLPLRVHLLHRKKGRFEYADAGTILSAIETYQTLLCIVQTDDTSLDLSGAFSDERKT